MLNTTSSCQMVTSFLHSAPHNCLFTANLFSHGRHIHAHSIASFDRPRLSGDWLCLWLWWSSLTLFVASATLCPSTMLTDEGGFLFLAPPWYCNILVGFPQLKTLAIQRSSKFNSMQLRLLVNDEFRELLRSLECLHLDQPHCSQVGKMVCTCLSHCCFCLHSII